VIFAGGGEEEDWSLAMMFDGMGALSKGYNDQPEKASRAYDAGRDGFVIAAGGGMLVLEELDHARARGAKIYAEITGYGATSDGDNMVAPSGEGAVRCMEQAIAGIDPPIDYINTHGTSTPVGDIAELTAMRGVFGDAVPPFSSSKSLCGHSLGAAGVQEAVHCLLMMKDGFMAGSANISELDPDAEGLPVLLETRENTGLDTVMSNNFGFGGTNASIVFQRYS
jgi:3-oxoacyl-[acyl-carrier-protein] synthase-1